MVKQTRNNNVETSNVKKEKKNDFRMISCLLDNFSKDQCFVLANNYLTPEIIGVFKDNELKECIDILIKTNLNVNEASKNLFMHRNTLLHRIDKIESITGYNLKVFDDAVTLLVMEAIYDKTKDLL